MTTLVTGLADTDHTQLALVGGKAANLGDLLAYGDVVVPPGFVVTTDAFRAAVAELPSLAGVLADLTTLAPDDRDAIAVGSARVRDLVGNAPVSDDLAAAISTAVDRYGTDAAYAVRSSATAEDLPDASFAGQQDSFLDVVGFAAIVEDIRRCWASLFTERAVAYRLRHGFAHHEVAMAVVVQRMVRADAAGVLFTADPVTSDRTVVTVEAVPGLGEALVSGTTNPDVYTVRGSSVTAATAGDERVLTDGQVLELAAIGRRLEMRAGQPQDVEWCLADGGFAVVQSRPITTAFPPPPTDDDVRHVYVSVGHQQMMTDAMTPLGLSLWHRTTAARMVESAGRLFVDVTARLAEPAGRVALLDLMGRGDPLIRDALTTLLERDGVDVPPAPAAPTDAAVPDGPADAGVVAELVASNEASVAALAARLADLTGAALFDALPAAFEEDIRILFEPRSLDVIMAGMGASWWLDDHLAAWLGLPNVADTLTLSAPGNVTSEMGLALLDVADVVRPHPQVVALLERVEGDETVTTGELLDRIGGVADGGRPAREALDGYLARYGMRCAGEIDVSRPRWSEQPGPVVSALLGNVRNLTAGESRRRFEEGAQRAAETERDVLTRLRAEPDGESKADAVMLMTQRLRTFIGYREYPKYGKIARLFVYKQALLREAERLQGTGILAAPDDVFFLRYEEFETLARGGALPAPVDEVVARRRADFRAFEALTPPRVLTSDGEAVAGSYRRGDLPPGALAGLAVSAGTVEGRARVVLDMAAADLDRGDILVTRFTDPSWTPLFLTVTGLITEVGGQMTHGAVIAREYGLPAVVGVLDATRLIRDGQRIRVHGSAGFVELLDG